jgi:hypothetical protein
MISNVTSSTQAAAATSASTSSSAAQDPNVTTVLTPFGQLFVENLNGGDPTVVGFDYGHGYQSSSGDSTTASLSTSSSSNTASSSSTSSASDTASTSSTSSSSTSGSMSSKAVASSTTTSTTSTSGGSILTGVDSDDPTDVPTTESVFGDTPWETDATGSGPTGTFSWNPQYFATVATAEKVAAMVGGTVVGVNTMAETPANPVTQNEDNEMVELSDGGMINAGLVATFFTHGYQLSMVKQMVEDEVSYTQAAVQGVSKT